MATGALSTAADPWAGIRQLKFSQYDYEVPGADVGDSGRVEGYTTKLWGVDESALQAGGFNTKYMGVPEEVEPGLFRVTVQQPGMHKYDTADAFFRVDPATGMGTMVDDPTATRQVSSREKWRDNLEGEILPIAAAVLGTGYLAGAFPGAAGAAAPGAAGGALSAEQAAMIAANAPVGNAGGLAAWEAAQAGAAGASGVGGAVAGNADKAALLGNAGYGPGMTGTQTGVFDSILSSTGNTALAKGASDIAGSAGMSWLDTALSTGKSVFGNDWLTTAMSLVGAGVNQMNIEKAAQDQRDWLDQKDIDRRRRQAPGALPAMKTTVYTKGGG